MVVLPPYTVKMGQKWFLKHKVLTWPSNSPDLNLQDMHNML